MKTLLLLGVMVASGMVMSCKEELRVCDCIINGQPQKVQLTFSRKKQAKQFCEDAQTQFKKEDAGATCELAE